MASSFINTVDELIKFIIPLFSDEFNIAYDSNSSVYYFLNGGCYELARVIKHYFPKTQYVVRDDYDHIAILFNNRIYDAFDFYEDWQLKKYNIGKELYEKDLSKFTIVTEDEIDNFPVEFNRNDIINGKRVSDALIEEIDKIDSIKILPNGKKKKLN